MNRPSEHSDGSGGPGEGQVFLGSGTEAPLLPRPDQLTHIYQLSDPALSELGLDRLLNELLTRVREVLSVDTVAILLVDHETRELVARAAKGIEEEVEAGVRIPLGKGFAGRIAVERKPIYIADVDHADVLNPILREKGIQSLLGVPMIVESEIVGVLHVGSLRPRVFTNEDAAVLQLAAVQAGPAIERARLFEALEREHRDAVALQRSLLPERLPEVFGVRVAARYFPARDEVGGDWYDVIELQNGLIGIAIGDVVGHGVRAAALMGQLRTALRAYALEGYEPARALERLNLLLGSIRGRGMATVAYGIFDPETGVLRLASAGHPPPLVVSDAGDARFIETSGDTPLGVIDYATFHQTEAMLEGGDTLLLYTDGLVEVRGESLDAGLGRLLETSQSAPSAEDLCRQISDGMVPRGGGSDDIAFVAVQQAPASRTLHLHLPADPSVLARMRHALRRWLHAQGLAEDEIGEITLACGEACANAIEHAYAPRLASFELEAGESADLLTVAVRDMGKWRAPRGRNRGRGITIMEALMDDVQVNPSPNGTEVLMRRKLGSKR